MIAAIDKKVAARVGKLSFFDVLHPRPVHANGYVVFGFARYSTRVAADALTLIDHEGILFHSAYLSLFWRRTRPLHIQCTEKERQMSSRLLAGATVVYHRSVDGAVPFQGAPKTSGERFWGADRSLGHLRRAHPTPDKTVHHRRQSIW